MSESAGDAGGSGDRPIKVLCWSERTEPEWVYPEGIDGAIAEGLRAVGGFEVRVAHLAEEDQGLSDLDWADVLVWFGHLRHRQVTDESVQRIVSAVRERGMGFIPIHSSQGARPFHAVLDHAGSLGGWREDGCPSVVSVVQPDHAIARGVSPLFVIPMEETYAEPYAIRPPDELVFLSAFAGGEVFRSGCCWYVGKGRVFYFQPGHETYPVYFQREVRQIMANACRWASDCVAEASEPIAQASDSEEAQRELHLRVGKIEGAPDATPEEVQRMAETFRWASREIRGGMDAYVRVRAAARADACARVAAELESLAARGNDVLLELAASLRARSLSGAPPSDVKLPALWPGGRPMPELDSERLRLEQRVGFSLGLAQCASQIHVSAGGRV